MRGSISSFSVHRKSRRTLECGMPYFVKALDAPIRLISMAAWMLWHRQRVQEEHVHVAELVILILDGYLIGYTFFISLPMDSRT